MNATDTVAEEVAEPRSRPMATSRRVALVGLALTSLALVVVLGVMVTHDRAPLDAVDRWGRTAEDWADDHDVLVTALRLVEVAFATIGMIIWTTLLVVALAGRRRYRAAAFATVAMITASLATTGMKLGLGRDRPEWQDKIDLLDTHSFPSGHASSSAALAGVLVFLAWSLLSGRRVRWAVTVLAVLVWLVVCLDRVLLGRHFPTDVVAGTFLGIAVVLLGIVVFDPARVRRRGS